MSWSSQDDGSEKVEKHGEKFKGMIGESKKKYDTTYRLYTLYNYIKPTVSYLIRIFNNLICFTVYYMPSCQLFDSLYFFSK